MLKKICMICALVLFAAAPAHAAKTAYFSAMNDLPLMAGMVEQPADDAVVFDKPAGRIVEFSATTAAPPPSVLKFYRASLPPLGWKLQKGGVFIRADEKLKMDFSRAHGKTLVNFTLTPND